MKRAGDFAVVYDISDDKERAQVDKLLKGFGFRVQKSVFECTMDRKGKEDLLSKLRSLNLKTGFIKIYRLEYSSNQDTVGEKKSRSIDEGPAFVV
jgi:CRISPR-associated protein Cas2